MALNVTDAYSAQFNQFVQFASGQVNAAKSKTVARLDPPGGSLATRTISVASDDKAYAIRRSATAKAENNAVRDSFKKAVADMFGGESRIPQSVLKAMEMKDYDKGKPLTARRIMAVKAAVDSYHSYGDVDFFAKHTNVALAARLGYTDAELPKLNRAINLFMAANPGIPEDNAILETMTPGRPANRLMGYGGRFMEDPKSFAQGLKLIGDFENWHADLKAHTSFGSQRTSLTAINKIGSIGASPVGLETFVFEELASNRNINLFGTPEEVFGMKNNPAMRFFGRDLHASNSFTFLQMPPEKRAVFFRCTDLLMPLKKHVGDPNGGAKSGALSVARILRHFDELERLHAKGQLSQKTLLATCFPDIQNISTKNPDETLNAHISALPSRLTAYIEEKTGKSLNDPSNTQGQLLYAEIGMLINQKGLTFEEACDFSDRGETPPPGKLEVPFSSDIEGVINPQSGLTSLTKDFNRAEGYSRSNDPQGRQLLQNPHFTVNLPNARQIDFMRTTTSDPVHTTKMQNLYDELETLCGRSHPRQLNALLFSLGQGALAELRSGFPSLGIVCNEHSAVNFTISRDDNTGAVTVRYDSPQGCPVTFNWSTTIDVDGHVTTTPMQLVNQPTP